MRLHAQNLTLERSGRRLFTGMSFAIKESETLLVEGANGAGKSSLLRAVAGFLPFSSGSLRIEGGDPAKTLGEQTHYLGHADSLRSALTARENLVFWANMLGGDPQKVEAALARLGLPHVADFPVRVLSAGQRRRVALSRMLSAQRKLWLLDEPTTALDNGSQTLFADVMREHLASGGLIVAATHAALGIPSTFQIQLDARAFVSAGAAA